MALTFTIDNDRILAGIQQLTLDETATLQTTLDTNGAPNDVDDDVGATYNSTTNILTSAALDTAFVNFISNLFPADPAEDTALGFLASVGGASSSDTFIQVTATAGETVDNLFFSIAPGAPTGLIPGMTSLADEALYFHIDANTDFATLTTSAAPGGRIVAAFYLDESDDHLSAQVQMVTFEPIKHPDTANPDDALAFTDVLQISAAGSTNFTFNNLPSGENLYAAFGSTSTALLVTGDDLNVSHSSGIKINGGSDPSDSVNTSQAAPGSQATIGINSQHFTYGGTGGNKVDGSIADLTLVSGFIPLTNAAGNPVVGDNVQDIDYGGYINTAGAGIDISQLTGGHPHADLRVSLWEAGGGTTPEESFSYIDNSFTNEAEIGDESALHDDAPIDVGQVKVTHLGAVLTFNYSAGATITLSNISVHFETSNTFTVTGLGSYDKVDWTTAGGDTFNRFKIQALATSSAFDLGGVHITQGSTSSLGLGSHLFVDDDGPTISASTTQPSLTVDESVLATDASASFASVFTKSFGTDGAATSNSLTYALGVSASGADSGLIDTATGLHVFLFVNGSGQVVGKAGTDAAAALAGTTEVFVVSVDSDGVVTLDQKRAVVHPDGTTPDTSEGVTLPADTLVTLTATATDKDGDHAAATANIGQNLNFLDDGPTISASTTQPLLTVDESVLTTDASASFASVFTSGFGADGAATSNSLVYALGVSASGADSGLIDTATGLHVFLFVNGSGQVVGKAGTDAAAALAGTTEVFVVSVDSSGVVTLDQKRAVVHPDGTTPDTSEGVTLPADTLVTLTATATDKDGDHAAATANIGQNLNFLDDGPTISASTTQPLLTVDESVLTTDASASFASVFTSGFGADGAATSNSLVYALGVSASGADSGLIDTATGLHVFLFVNGSGQVVGKAGTDAAAALAGTTEVFVVSVDSSGVVTLDQKRAVVHPDGTAPDTSEGVTLSADTLVTLTATLTDKDGDHAAATANIGQNLNFLDDGPTVTGTIVTNTVDDDGSGTGNAGGTGDIDALKVVTGTVTGIFNGGADGLQSFDMSIVTTGLPSNLHSQGGLVLYDVTGNLLTAYVDGGTAGYQAAEDREVFTFDLVGSTGAYTFTLIDQIDHPTTTTEDNLSIQLGILLQVTDKDGDHSPTAALTQLVITDNDDSPVVTTLDANNDTSTSNDDVTSLGATGNFLYAIGFDDRHSTIYSSTNTDLLVTFTGGTVGDPGTAFTNKSISWFSENDDQATFHFSFTYVSNPADNTTTVDTGVLTFDKDAGTYTFTLTDPISSFGILSLATATGFTGYLPGTATVDTSQPEVTIAALADDFFVQFTGAQETGGGTDGNNTLAKNSNLDAFDPGETWSSSSSATTHDDDAFTDGELFTQTQTWVSVSGTAAGTAGDTMQAGEVLDFNFFREDPHGVLNPAAIDKATTSTMFIEFDGLDNGEDLVVLLKLVDRDDPTITTTRAVIVQYDDIFHIAQAADIPPGFVVPGSIDQNDGLVVIESNDYNFGGTDNWTIAGAQVVASTEGLTGTGIDLNRATGVNGGSAINGTDPFNIVKDAGGNNGGTWDGDVFKIVNIGFLTEITPDSQFNFGVQVIDFDGDTSPLQTLGITVFGDSFI